MTHTLFRADASLLAPQFQHPRTFADRQLSTARRTLDSARRDRRDLKLRDFPKCLECVAPQATNLKCAVCGFVRPASFFSEAMVRRHALARRHADALPASPTEADSMLCILLRAEGQHARRDVQELPVEGDRRQGRQAASCASLHPSRSSFSMVTDSALAAVVQECADSPSLACCRPATRALTSSPLHLPFPSLPRLHSTLDLNLFFSIAASRPTRSPISRLTKTSIRTTSPPTSSHPAAAARAAAWQARRSL